MATALQTLKAALTALFESSPSTRTTAANGIGDAIAGYVGSSGVANHDALDHLDYATAGHTGFVPDTDSRLSNARTPLAHAASHKAGAADHLVDETVVGDMLTARWDDLRVALTQVPTGPGLSGPPVTLFRDDGAGSVGVYARKFRHTSDDEVIFTVQFPHGWVPGVIKPHVHWSPGADGVAQSGNAVRWRLEYTVAAVHGVFPVAQSIDMDDTVTGTNYLHEITSDTTPTIDLSAYSASSVMLCRLTRINAVANNAPVGLFATDFDIHIQVRGWGTVNSNGSGGR